MIDKNDWFVAKERLSPVETDGVKAVNVNANGRSARQIFLDI